MVVNKGEVRKVGIEVISQIGETFVIETADYKILKADGTVLENGVASIDGNTIITLFSAQETGQFVVVFTYRIGAEILIGKVFIKVVE